MEAAPALLLGVELQARSSPLHICASKGMADIVAALLPHLTAEVLVLRMP